MNTGDVKRQVLQESCESLLSVSESLAKIINVYLSEMKTASEEKIERRLCSVLKVANKCVSFLISKSAKHIESLSGIADIEKTSVCKLLQKYIAVYKENSGDVSKCDISIQTDTGTEEHEGGRSFKDACSQTDFLKTELEIKDETRTSPNLDCGEDVQTNIERSNNILRKLLCTCESANDTTDKGEL